MTDVFRTRPQDARNLAGWYRLPSGIEVMREPFTDDPSGLYSRLDYDELEALATTMGARLISMATLAEVWRFGCRIPPVTLVSSVEDTKRMRGRAFCEHHDSLARTHLAAAGWRREDPNAKPISGLGKHWIRGATKGKARNGGWPKPSGQFIQPGGAGSEHHDRKYTDYSQLGQLEREVGISMPPAPADPRPPGAPMRSTIREGSRGADVGVLQRILGVTADEVFGPATGHALRAWQTARGLFADGVVGPQTWRAAGEVAIVGYVPVDRRDPVSAACRAALRDANATWPTRSRRSDGTMGDAAHQARPSDHNTGLAVDITHDPASGCDGELVAMMARRDPRVVYVIWKKRIWNRTIDTAAGPGRPYTGANPHEHHVHISVSERARNDGSPWPWAAPGDEAA